MYLKATMEGLLVVPNRSLPTNLPRYMLSCHSSCQVCIPPPPTTGKGGSLRTSFKRTVFQCSWIGSIPTVHFCSNKLLSYRYLLNQMVPPFSNGKYKGASSMKGHNDENNTQQALQLCVGHLCHLDYIKTW